MELTVKIIAAIGPILVFFLSRSFTFSSAFKQEAQVIFNTNKIIYLKLLDLYTANEEKEELVKKFIETFSFSEINTTHVPTHHYHLLSMKQQVLQKKTFKEIEPFFDRFSILIETDYWNHQMFNIYTLEKPEYWIFSAVRKKSWLYFYNMLTAKESVKKYYYKELTIASLILILELSLLYYWAYGLPIEIGTYFNILMYLYIYLFLFFSFTRIMFLVSAYEDYNRLKFDLERNKFIKRTISSYKLY
ncbi:hypothetical protein ACSFXN_18385 [Planococcus sp. 1R117A]|uniref:hypothetical protein n=1 Tax=Planococcus sp. 1R117A TaxID=3447020 RepID=UPI003EDB8879